MKKLKRNHTRIVFAKHGIQPDWFERKFMDISDELLLFGGLSITVHYDSLSKDWGVQPEGTEHSWSVATLSKATELAAKIWSAILSEQPDS